MKQPFHKTVAENLIARLKAGTAPWQQPWEPSSSGFMPTNPVTGNRYKGINAIHLMAQANEDNRWLTYRQAQSVGAQVRRGEQGAVIQYWKCSERRDKLDANGNPALDERGKPIRESVMLSRPRIFFATVFNAGQIDGLPPVKREQPAWNPSALAEHILTSSGAEIEHGQHNRAFYRISTDSIHLPNKDQFASADRYYATALHELGHWTGHPSRLDRDLSYPFGSEGYAREELRAEIASMILGDELGIGHDPAQHAAYVQSWIKILEDDPLEIFRAAADAEKIQNYILVMSHDVAQNQAETLVADPEPDNRIMDSYRPAVSLGAPGL